MTARHLAAAVALRAVLAVLAPAAQAAPDGEWTGAERAAILRHGPWPPAVTRDASNRFSGNGEAIALGRMLFFDARLAPDGARSCAFCHQPQRDWTDGRALPVSRPPRGRETLARHTPSLWNAALGRWFGWGGGSDSIWSFSLRPIRHPLEFASSAAQVARTLRGDAALACRYAQAAGAPPPADDEALTVDAAKAIAAFVETLVSGRTPFDDYRDALARGDAAAMSRYPAAARRGLRLFVGRGRCNVCHFGPAFTNGEFADIGVKFFVAGGGVDGGRHAGIQRLRADANNRLGARSDDAGGASASRTRHVALRPRNFGEFKVPGLRNVARTAPYMHNGSVATLDAVIRHYSELDEDRLHADGERILRPLRLGAREAADLRAFLVSLSDGGAAAAPSGSASPCASPRAP